MKLGRARIETHERRAKGMVQHRFATTLGRRRHLHLAIAAAALVVIVFALLPAQHGAARPTFSGGACSPTYGGCHDGAQTASMMAITGLPAGSFIPGQSYNIKITIADTNGLGTGQNTFDLIVDSGTLSTTDGNVEIVSASSEAKGNTAVDLKYATTFNVTWTAPLSSSANIEIWGVMGDGGGSTHDIWDREVYSYSAVPEFPVIVVPIVGIGLAVMLAARLSRKK